MIHVLHVVPTLARGGGTELALVRVVRGLSRPAFRHSIICLTDQPAIGDQFGQETPIHSLRGDRDPLDQLWRLRSLIRDLAPSVVHARNPTAWLDLAIMRLTLLRRPPMVLSFHGTDRAGPLAPRTRLLAALAARSARVVFAVSEGPRDTIAKALGLSCARVGVIPNGVDTVRFAPGTREPRHRGAIVVGTVGNLLPIKNQILLVQACAELRKRGHAVELRIAGVGPEHDRLRLAAESLGCANTVQLHGYVHDVPAFLQALDLFALTSDSEGHPNALIEAMACGLPCVASRVGGIPDVLPDDAVGRLFEPGDLGGLVSALEELVAEPEAAAELGRAARKRVEERYSLDDMLLRYATLYSDVARG